MKTHLPLLGEKIYEHLLLSGSSIFLAILGSIPLGILITRISFLRRILLNIGSVSQTIPSLAFLAFLIPFLGLGNPPTLTVLTIYAFYPILRSTYVGIQNIPAEYKEAAEGLGFSMFQKIWFIEIPLALPVIIAGLRIATSSTIGITTIAAFIGAGGLGDFITQGLALNDYSLILLGAIPTALLALSFDYAFSELEKYIHFRPEKKFSLSFVKKGVIGLIFSFLLFSICYFFIKDPHAKMSSSIVIGSKNFTEQYILSELMAQLLEDKTNLKIIRKFNLGTTDIVHTAFLKGEIDLYPEYTGTAYLTILKEPWNSREKNLLKKVKKAYEDKFDLLWLEPFGFSNSQSLSVQKNCAEKYDITTLSDLGRISRHLTIAVPPEFLMRADGLPHLSKIYNLNFKKILQLDIGLLYTAIGHQKVDVIVSFTTDGKAEKYNLKILKDDKNFYPPYDAAPVIRKETLKTYPEIYKALKPLFGLITENIMKKLNYEVDVKGNSPKNVARAFLLKYRLISLKET